MGEKQYIGCTGSPADSHLTVWCVTSKERPYERCSECGSVYKLDYVGPPDEARHVIPDWEPKDFSDFVSPEYKGWPQGKGKP
jgi:cytochrome c oxidase subunit 5b